MSFAPIEALFRAILRPALTFNDVPGNSGDTGCSYARVGSSESSQKGVVCETSGFSSGENGFRGLLEGRFVADALRREHCARLVANGRIFPLVQIMHHMRMKRRSHVSVAQIIDYYTGRASTAIPCAAILFI